MGKDYIPMKLKKALDFLGNEYRMKVIDLEQCGYRDLGDGYDLEISGLSDKRKKLSCSVYLWKKDYGYTIIHHRHDISSYSHLKKVLDDYAENKEKYLEQYNNQRKAERNYLAMIA